jgi:hypothetical protein
MKTLLIAAVAVVSLGTNLALAQGAPGASSYQPPQYGTTAWGASRQPVADNGGSRQNPSGVSSRSAGPQDTSGSRAARGG